MVSEGQPIHNQAYMPNENLKENIAYGVICPSPDSDQYDRVN